VVLDADGQHPPDEIPKLLAESDGNPDAFVLSVRQEGQPIAAVRLVLTDADWHELVAGYLSTRSAAFSSSIVRTLALDGATAWSSKRGSSLPYSGIPVRSATRVTTRPPLNGESLPSGRGYPDRMGGCIFRRQCCALP
jgi:hypothetical protein